ncbi:DUF6156 family protein [Plasticicumulans acidivorans]|uniref:YD repeat-containing protein n=1 Tax=Plasticicumulans acidivorans TaxID=886464 RepID=A0A317N0D3_9GAMM|nr:DUF6156 family protein [Plasticicumulans acidivorans]PWV65580.1 hypothetical protein C7443_10164 [Plasticicumulans acidivorans]
MSTDIPGTPRTFVTYTGVKLPFRLVNELSAAEVDNRNTYFVGYYDGERINGLRKMVYGSIELEHHYSYHANGQLAQARIVDIDEEETVLCFDEAGQPLDAA